MPEPLLATEQYFGFAIEADLFQQIQILIERIRAGDSSAALQQQAAHCLIQLTDSGFAAYYQQPADLANFSPGVKKASDLAMQTVQKSIHVVVRKVIRNRSSADLQRMSRNMTQLLCVNKAAPPPAPAYLCFALDPGVYQKLRATMARIRADRQLDGYRHDVISSIEALIQAGIDVYYTRPADAANLGRLTRKAADLGIHAVQRGSCAVTRKVFGKISHKDLLPLVDYMETLLHPRLTPLDEIS